MYKKLPRVESTQQERIDALKVGREVLNERQIFKQGGVDVFPVIRIAEYITTGHDYLDTHPEGQEPEYAEDSTIRINLSPEQAEKLGLWLKDGGDDEEDEDDFGL